MSNLPFDSSDNVSQPLAAHTRPENLVQYIDQQHLLMPGKSLQWAIKVEHLHLITLWGSPGIGKTTFTGVTVRYANADVE